MKNKLRESSFVLQILDWVKLSIYSKASLFLMTVVLRNKFARTFLIKQP